MPTISDVVNAAIPAGMSLAQWLASQKSLNNATGTITQGVNNASTGLNTASQQAIAAQKAALAAQQGIATGSVNRTDAATQAALAAQGGSLAAQQQLYQKTIDANAPYAATGTEGVNQLKGLITDPNSLSTTPGYQFELSQGLKGGERAAAASGTAGNGGTIKAQTRYALDFANTKYNDAVQRLLQVTNVGQTANAANASAGVTLGNQTAENANEVSALNTQGANANNATMATLGSQTGTEAANVGNIGTQNAENQASLTLAQAQLAAKNQTLQGNNTASTIQSLTPTIAAAAKAIIPALLGNAAAPSLSAIVGGVVPALPTIAGTTPALAATALPTAGLVPGAGSGIAGGGISGIASSAVHALSVLASSPITWGVAAAIGGALIWRSTQTHQTANTFVDGYQKPFGQHLGNVVDEFDKALASGQLTKADAQAARDQTAQLIQQFEADGAQFAQKGDKEASVWNQAQRTMAEYFGGKVDATGHGNQPDWSKILGKMDAEIAQLPDQAAA